MIYSPSFLALPPQVKGLVVGKINRVLAGAETDKKFAHLTPAVRQAIAEILKTTLPL